MKNVILPTFIALCSVSGLMAQLSLQNQVIPSAAGQLSGGNFVSITTVGETASGSQSVANFSSNIGFGSFDFYPPMANCKNIVVELVNGSAAITPDQIDFGSSDNFGIAQLSLDKMNFTEADLGPNTVTLTVTDLSGLTSQCSATVTVTQMTTNTDLWLIQ